MTSNIGNQSWEWPVALDVDEQLRGGWRARPFRQFLLKVHSRCNLACDYCYVYTLADQSWRGRPMVMDPQLVSIAAQRIAEHAADHDLPSVRVVLHGGEPLLAGHDYLAKIVDVVRSEVGPGLRVEAVLQTNAVLLDEAALASFDAMDVRVGVSLDGGPGENDRNRRFADGRGSYQAVVRGLTWLTGERFRHLFSGLLCTVDLINDPIETYEALSAFDPPTMDFLLPHATWDTPPPGLRRPATPYADWLIPIFDRWYESGSESVIRIFQEIVSLLLGGGSASESVGLTPSTVVVIETDGTIEQTDSLKAVRQGAPTTGLNIVDHSFDEALRHPGMVARQLGWAALSDTCKACRFGRVCGGGLYTHRYRSGEGFKNPSVYCNDLYRLIDHIRERLIADLRGSAR
ncbi:FxsB family cyclophane-forming radical SAM/SPASM peptide maturase [Nonomuraea sp. M3C6]|uniref:FxsB family cyclophane-forming radical SAM/SPASM peptide maturase n=1 Tax=Nonomuraea marmarensis TaxID=3351344 RepID=A0ABW7AE96_9ACTN